MGEVWRAHDLQLRRDVALKILPDGFASDPERLARLGREAQVLASLNHPNIAQIYAVETSDATRALVMELVEGETLADRIAKGPIPIDEALPIAKQIAEALEAAHEQGIIHRDLKPANVKVRPDGTVKVLDFGLAKLAEPPTPAATAAVTNSPTITSPAMMTGVGVLLGTAAYMSPEQARGKPADTRSDIWAFGCVLYEMLTAHRAFGGDDVADFIVAIMTKEPEWQALPRSLPLPIHHLLRRCLKREPRERLRDIGDAGLAVQDALAASISTLESSTAPARRMPSVMAIGALIAGVSIGAIAVRVWQAPSPRPYGGLSPHLGVPLPEGRPLWLGAEYGDRPVVAISPDGSSLVFTVREGLSTRLYLRRLDQSTARPIAGSEDGFNPFFSADSQWIGFFTLRELRRVPLAGGSVQSICQVSPVTRGAAWSPDDTIFLVDGVATGITRIPRGSSVAKAATCGTLGELFTSVRRDEGERSHRWPTLLPRGRAVLFSVVSGGDGKIDASDIVVQSVNGGERRVLVRAAIGPQYVPSGHLVYVRDGVLFAVPFDQDTLRVTGSEARVIDPVVSEAGGAAQFSVSNTGSLAYASGTGVGGERTLVWVDREGVETPVEAPRRRYADPTLTQDGRSIAVSIYGNGDVEDIWHLDLARGLLGRVTFRWGIYPAWTPNGERIAFSSVNAVPSVSKAPYEYTWNIFWQAADGSGRPEPLVTRNGVQFTGSWTPDGRTLVFADSDYTAFQLDIWTVSTEGDRQPHQWLNTPFDEIQPMISPDGQWLAYVSNESGRYEIYVRSFAAPERGKWLVSTDGGTEPRWSRNGREIVYRNGDAMMAADVTSTRSGFQSARPHTLFNGQYVSGGTRPGYPQYDLAPDGKRFIMIRDAVAPAPPQLSVVVNWSEELKARVPTK